MASDIWKLDPVHLL